MKIEHKIIKDGIVQVTTSDERWYVLGDKFYPSVTFILESYPKGYGYTQWLKQQGDNADVISSEARDRGSRVHHAIDALLGGAEILHDATFTNSEGVEAELTAVEYEAIISFANWWKASKAKLLQGEFIVVNKEHGFAGTVDLLCEIAGETWLIDLKTSKEVWPSYELQVSAYKNSIKEVPIHKIGILQIGYRRNKNGYKLTEVEDDFDTFLSVKKVWEKEHGDEHPTQRDLPLSIKL